MESLNLCWIGVEAESTPSSTLEPMPRGGEGPTLLA
jgi:hypothetical protein